VSNQKVFASTWSPTFNKTPQILSSKIEMEKLKHDLLEKDKLILKQQEIISSMKEERVLFANREEMYCEDIGAKDFYISVQEQQIAQLEDSLSSHRIQQNESINKIKRYKVSLKQLSKDREEFEKKSNLLILQLNEQMTQLQKLAIDRIQVREFFSAISSIL
jgi:septal ring factor EnvC (AmiA/AmiB activator)